MAFQRMMGNQLADDRKKVLLVSTNADWAGAPIHVLTLATALNEVFEVLAVFGEEGPVRDALVAKGIRSMVIPSLRSSLHPVRDLLSLLSLLKIIRTVRPDLLHAHSSKAGMIARMAACISRLPCLYTVHGWGFGPGRARLQSAVVYWVERILSYTPNTAYIFVSNADLRTGAMRLKLAPRRCKVIHNGVPDHGFRAQVANSSTVIMAARVCHQKDHELLLQAFEDCHSPFRLLLVGEGTDAPSFREKVKLCSPGKHTKVDCLGLNNQVPRLLAQSGVFVLCSRYEGLPLSIIEAMCAGLPIVATDVGGVCELVEEGVNGFLAPVGDSAAISKHLDRLQQDVALRIRMGQASRDHYVAKFGSGQMTAATTECYHSMLGV